MVTEHLPPLASQVGVSHFKGNRGNLVEILTFY